MSPIKTIIRNLTATPYTIYWAGSMPLTIPANGERILDFEVWSAAGESQKKAVIKAAGSGSFELSLLILGKDGAYAEVAYHPEFAAAKPPTVVYESTAAAPIPGPAPEVPQEAFEPPKEPMKMKVKEFNVIATSQEAREQMEKLGARPASEIEQEVQPVGEQMPTVKAGSEATEAAMEAAGAEKVEAEAKPAKKSRSKK